jgi:quercetin dioxygenase-like cupin family protein
VLIAGMIVMPAQSQATPAVGVIATQVSRAAFADHTSVKLTVSKGRHKKVYKAKDASDVVVQTLTFDPGANTGWHSHPGPVIVSVRQGTVTYYDGKGPCVGRRYPAGTAFIDPGDGNVHTVRNETTEPAQTSAVFFGVPAGGLPRIDEPSPGNCPF